MYREFLEFFVLDLEVCDVLYSYNSNVFDKKILVRII